MDGEEGLNNMGLATMQLIDFMCNELNWTLGVVNGGNVGKTGEIREQQIIFKAPHPMNAVVPHVLIELRSAGYEREKREIGIGPSEKHEQITNDK